MTSSRLDLLIYAHDGRGLGHVSRSIGVGLAVRRLYPDLRVLLVTGSAMCGELVGAAPLDYLKLPAYATRVEGGRSWGVDGPSGFSDGDLGRLRAAMLADIVRLYQPRLVLCDHSPLGKHKELLPAQDAGQDTGWILGVRGVVGSVPQVFSERAREVFAARFSGLLWYGDERILGKGPLRELEACFACKAVVCGYVSRLGELTRLLPEKDKGEHWAGTIAIPWQGTPALPGRLAEALARIGPEYGRWKVFAPAAAAAPFAALPFVSVERPGSRYGEILPASRMAVVYGGYNSLTDVLALGIPSLVLRRSLQDREQELHLEMLCRATGELLFTLDEESATSDQLEQGLRDRLMMSKKIDCPIRLDGAATAARALTKQRAVS